MKLYVRDKAAILLGKLYQMWKTNLTTMTINDFMAKATPEEIEFYYHKICEKENKNDY